MPCQPSGESAKRLTAPLVLVNSQKHRSRICLCTQRLPSGRSSSFGKPVAPLSPLPREVCAQLRHVARWSTLKEKEQRVKKITFAVLAWIAVCAFGGPRVVAQTTSSVPAAAADSTAGALTDQQLALLRKDIRSIKKQVIAANLTLTDSEATKFWPVYEQYSVDFAKINDIRAALVKEYSEVYGTQTDEQADSLVRRWLDVDIAAAQLRQKYVPIFRKVLPGKKAATFFQLDRRISMMIDVQLTSQLPLMQSQD